MKIKEVIVENKDVRSLNERKRKRKRKPTTRTVYGGWWGGYPLDNSSGEGGGEGVAEDSLNEFAPTAGAGDDILKTLATQWLHGDIASGDLSSDIQSQEQIERKLEKGIICPDGVKRKLYIDYNQDYDGVIIYGDDDWSIEYKQDDLTESKQGVAEASSSAQQAAIAVAMKRAGKKPKIKEGVVIKGPWKGSGEEPPENKDDEKSGLIRALRNKLDQYSESRKKRKYIQIANKFTDMAHKAMEQAEQLPITDPNKLKYQRQLKHCFDLAKYYSMLGGEEPYSQGFISMMRRTFPNLTKDPFENE